MESKVEICKLFEQTLKATRQAGDLESLVYTKDEHDNEYVLINYANGFHSRACVTWDSGISMLSDILKAII